MASPSTEERLSANVSLLDILAWYRRTGGGTCDNDSVVADIRNLDRRQVRGFREKCLKWRVMMKRISCSKSLKRESREQ